MDWTNLLSNKRLHKLKHPKQPNRSIFEQDYDRIVFSDPFRRLANKTQVQPLYEHDHVRHRLIHSIEVGSVGRSLAMAIGQWLVKEKKDIENGEENDLANIVQAACAAHDIGNPPFGHSGENAIGAWFSKKFDSQQGMFAKLDPALREEFCAFEGNAQGFRIIARTEMYRNEGGMRLTKAVLGAFMKYPLSAATKKALAKVDYKKSGYFGKKFGIFNSELPLFQEVADTLKLAKFEVGPDGWWRRHPLVFVVEAADDICYKIADLEDAFTTGELQFGIVRDALYELAGKLKRTSSDISEAEEIAYLRAVSIGKGIESCLEAFKENYSSIKAGTFSRSLVDAGGLHKEFEKISCLTKKKVFTAQRKTELEVSGHRIIGNVLSGILPVYEHLAAKNWNPECLDDHSQRVKRALSLDLRGISNVEQALHGMTDFVSGMTDRYALRISQMLSGM